MLSTRTLGCFLAVSIGVQFSSARAGQLLNLPLEVSQYFQSIEDFKEDDYGALYVPTTITTSDHETFEITDYELVELLKASPILAEAIGSSPSSFELKLDISSQLFKLLRRLTHEGEDAKLKLEGYSREELQEMLKIATRLKCEVLEKKLSSFLGESEKDRPKGLARSASRGGGRNRVYSSLTELKKPKEQEPKPQSLRRATTSLERFHKITVKLPDYVKELWKFEEWFADKEFQDVACHYYSWVLTDEQFGNFISKLYKSENPADREMALKWFKCFMEDGFSSGKPKDKLVKALFKISTDLDREESESQHISQWTNKLLEFTDEADETQKVFDVGQDINWKDYSDKEIAQAWNVANAIRFRSMPHLRSEKGNPDMHNKLAPMGKAFDKYVAWIRSEVRPEGRETDFELVNRFCRIATIMLLQANFHGAFTVFCALKGSRLLDNVGISKKETIQKAFDERNNYGNLRKAINVRREKQECYIYEVQLYSADFEPLMEACEKNKASEKDVAIVKGKFLKQMRRDQRAAASYQAGDQAELVAFFIWLGHDGEEEKR